MTEILNFLLFGDQSLSVYETLVDFFKRESYGILSKSFLDRTATALQDEVDRLSSIDRARMPNFSNIQQLNERYHAQVQKTSSLDSALLIIAQLALYIESIHLQCSVDQQLTFGLDAKRACGMAVTIRKRIA
jgi:iron transport multicopper oxidase